jgi:PAS domain S-box-containing protein
MSTATRFSNRKLILIGGVVFVYGILALPLYRLFGPGAGSSLAIPFLFIAWLCPRRVMVIVWLFTFPLNILLLNATGYAAWEAIFRSGAVAGFIILLVTGLVVNHTQTISWRLQEELAHRLQAEGEVNRQHQEFEALYQASLQLVSSLQLQPILETILEHAVNLMGADNVHVFLYDGQKLSFGAALWGGAAQPRPINEPRQDGITYTVARTGKARFIGDVNQDSLFQHWLWGGAIASLPLISGERVYGVMNIAFDRLHTFSETEIRRLHLMANQAAIAIEHATLYADVQRQAKELEWRVAERTAELNAAKEQAEGVLNNSFDAILLCNLDLEVEQANPALYTLFGFAAGSLPASILTLVGSTEKESFLDRLRSVIATQQPVRAEVTLQRADGTHFVADVALTCIPGVDLRHSKIICSIHDIQARIEAERRQQAMIADLRAIMAIGNELMSCPDLDSALRLAVEAARQKLGLERSAIFVEKDGHFEGTWGTDRNGQTVDEHALRIPVDETWMRRYAALTPEDAQWIEIEDDYWEWNGERTHIVGRGWIAITLLQSASGFRGVFFNDTAISGAPLDRSKQEIIVIFCSLLVKIIEQKRLEETIRRALEDATELSELKSRFISMISHEFRTPLATILSSSELVKRYHQRLSAEKRDAHLSTIMTQVHHMTEMLNNVLTISRAEKVGLPFSPRQMEVKPFCEALMEEIQLSYDSTHQMQLSVQDKCQAIHADETLLRQILANLLSNAVKYSPPDSCIRLDIDCGEAGVMLRVQDEGMGIPEEAQKHLFQDFFRAKNVEIISGTGLGLAIVKRAVEAHHGTITFESAVGKGTTFCVTLPQAEKVKTP